MTTTLTPERVCVVCQGLAEGTFGGDDEKSRYPVCGKCMETGAHDRWRERTSQIWRESGVAIESSGNYADDVKEILAYLKHNSRIADGVCPNGCALMVRDDDHNAHCPSCSFSYFSNSKLKF